jgi:hypothetical protein
MTVDVKKYVTFYKSYVTIAWSEVTTFVVVTFIELG